MSRPVAVASRFPRGARRIAELLELNVLNGCASAMMALSRDRVTQTCFRSDISRLVTEWPCSSAMAGERWGPERSLCRVLRPQGPQPGPVRFTFPKSEARADPTGLTVRHQPTRLSTREPAAGWASCRSGPVPWTLPNPCRFIWPRNYRICQITRPLIVLCPKCPAAWKRRRNV